MIRKFHLFLFLLGPIYLAAQSADLFKDLTDGPRLDLEKRASPVSLVSFDEAGSVLQLEETNFQGMLVSTNLLRIDRDLQPVLMHELVLDYDGKTLKFEEIVSLSDQLYVFSSFYNRKSKTNFLFTQRYNKLTLEPEGELLPVSELTEQATDSKDYWLIIPSESENRFATIGRKYSKKKRKAGSLIVRSFDAEASEISRQFFTLPGLEERISLQASTLADDGTVLFVIYDQGAFNARKGRTPTTTLYGIVPGKEDLLSTPLNLQGKLTYRHKLVAHEDGTLSIAGLYNSSIDKPYDGFFHFSFRPNDLKLLNTTFVPVMGLKDQYGVTLGGGHERADSGSPANYQKLKVDEILKTKDGGIFMVSSHPKSVTHTYSPINPTSPRWGTTTFSFSYHEGDITVLRLQADGTAKWIQTVPRKQEVTDFYSGILGQTVGLFDDQLYLYFNDAAQNIGNFNEEPVPLDVERGTLTRLIRFDHLGAFDDGAVLNEREKKRYIVPSLSFFDNKRGEILSCIYSKNTFEFSRFKF